MNTDQQRRYLARLSAASPSDLRRAITETSPGERAALGALFGPEALDEIEALATLSMRGPQACLGNVVVLPGIMGSELTAYDNADPDLLWTSIWRLIWGAFARLPLDPSTGLSVHDIRSSGLILRYYAKQLVALSRCWNARAFFFDWRRDIRVSSAALHESLNEWFGPDAPVHIVAHSMGGLVARSFIAAYPDHWARMADPDGLRRGGRLLMLGTPNYGSFSIPQLLSGENSVLDLISKIDLEHSLDELMGVAVTFPSVYQMLPAPGRLPSLDPLYLAATYRRVPVLQPLIDSAVAFQRSIAGAIDPSRMLYIAGYNRPTACSVADFQQLGAHAGYSYTNLGDGTVPHNLGLLDGVPSFYIDCDHQSLPQNSTVLDNMDSLLSTGLPHVASALPSSVPPPVVNAPPPTPEAVAAEHRARVGRLSTLSAALRLRGEPASPAREEFEIVDTVLGCPIPAPAPSQRSGSPIALHLVECPLENISPASPASDPPIDAIAAGHYLNVRPSGAERDLDRALAASGAGALLEPLHARGILRGELGETFLLPDPRPTHAGVLVALPGMGRIGGFGAPELTLLVQNLSWTLARLGKRHLATALIGAGQDNLSVGEAARAWLTGLHRAESDAGQTTLAAVTFAVLPGQGERLAEALWRASAECSGSFDLSSIPPPASRPEPESRREPAPTRITVEFSSGLCRCGVIGDSASVPERSFPLNARRVDQINAALLAESDPARRHRLGRFLFDFLFPRDLLSAFPGAAPLVLTCNSEAARVYWELAVAPSAGASNAAARDGFLGLDRSLTRQLRGAFAPPPEGVPPSGRALRVLIAADGAAESVLPGARNEAARLVSIFDSLNRAAASPVVDYTVLAGPDQATALNVLLALDTDSPYDVLHYAGHCLFDENAPEKSGFLFSGGDVLNAGDLGRLDRVPRFVFANACRSGELTPGAPLSDPGMASGFAASFFARGVSNFVGTAWPIEDSAAGVFAEALYSSLLGVSAAPAPMWQAMRTARRAIAASRSWPAYQHYGDPYFRLAA